MKTKAIAIFQFMALTASASALATESIIVESRKKPSPAPTKAHAAPLPALLKEVEAKYFKAATLIADFTEADQSATTKQTKKSSGKIQFKRPGKLHWETLKPDHNTLISDGKKFWFY